MLKIKENIDLKELEKYGWKLDTLDCFTTCENCEIKKCRIKEEEHYYKSISKILHYTIIRVSKINREIYGVFDDFRTIRSGDTYYKYVEIACEEEFKDGLVEKVEE